MDVSTLQLFSHCDVDSSVVVLLYMLGITASAFAFQSLVMLFILLHALMHILLLAALAVVKNIERQSSYHIYRVAAINQFVYTVAAVDAFVVSVTSYHTPCCF